MIISRTERVKDSLKSAALQAGWFLGRRTPKEELINLISRLRPVDCGKPLIRIGGAGDRGYLLPDDLEGIEYCFSPGVSNIVDFETHLAELNIKSFLADYSVAGPPVERPEFVFDKKFIGLEENDVFTTLQTWKDKYLKDYPGDLLLQMDIEGSEYDVIRSASPRTLGDFRMIVVEFHVLERLFDQYSFRTIFKPCFEKLLEQFYVVHIHPNNIFSSVIADGIEVPKILEFTFYNKKRVSGAVFPARQFPHPLDLENTPFEKPLVLPRIWRGA